ncbi:hypothetical protein GF374_00320 [Candidatus Woesearchaeota archaeon]|nr:hypothetical protein [Candidatus Woesearchaeota archaeon]
MSLLKVIKKSKNARKIFGKRELKIIEKQLLGVNLTQSEKNRLSRDIRKKLGFISKISRFKEEFDLKKGAEIKKMINEAKKVVLNDKLARKIKEIWLFGSAAENKMTLRSDIDIAVLFDKIDLKKATKFRVRVSGRVPDKIDIQVFNVLPKKLKKSILKNHKVLYKNE